MVLKKHWLGTYFKIKFVELWKIFFGSKVKRKNDSLWHKSDKQKLVAFKLSKWPAWGIIEMISRQFETIFATLIRVDEIKLITKNIGSFMFSLIVSNRKMLTTEIILYISGEINLTDQQQKHSENQKLWEIQKMTTL